MIIKYLKIVNIIFSSFQITNHMDIILKCSPYYVWDPLHMFSNFSVLTGSQSQICHHKQSQQFRHILNSSHRYVIMHADQHNNDRLQSQRYALFSLSCCIMKFVSVSKTSMSLSKGQIFLCYLSQLVPSNLVKLHIKIFWAIFCTISSYTRFSLAHKVVT